MQTKEFITTCADGVQIVGMLVLPEQPKAVIQFNGGTAVKKEYYLSFATFLATQGYVCCLWDYRGNGASRLEDLSQCTYQFSDYGTQDMTAIRAYLKEAYPDLPYFIVAHSVGGQQIGFMEELEDVVGALLFGVSAGYYPNMPWKYRLKAYFFFYIFGPLSILLSGYVQAKRFGFMEDLPRGVWKEWRSWLEVEHYFFDEKFYGTTVPIGHFQSYDFPIHLYLTEDDTIACPKNVNGFWDHVKSSVSLKITTIVPKDYHMKRIDHFGFFKKQLKDTLWQETVEQLNTWYDNYLIKEDKKR